MNGDMKRDGRYALLMVPLLAALIHSSPVPPSRPECPWDPAGEGIIPSSREYSRIREFHDCQRFLLLNPAGPRPYQYDSVYAVFAAFGTTSTQDQRPMATIYTLGTYPPLGIRPGFNCLLFHRESGGDWSATMQPIGNERNCEGVIPDDSATSLQVITSAIPSLSLDAPSYPPSARWDWDSKHSHQYIGITCDTLWCEVGPHGFEKSPDYPGPTPTFDTILEYPVTERELFLLTRIKGLYDAQFLDSIVGGVHVPSNTFAWLFANPALAHVEWGSHEPGMDIFTNKWRHVATAVLSGGTGDYKWNLAQGVNRIWLCHEKPPATGEFCHIDPLQRPFEGMKGLAQCDADPSDRGRWWAKIESANGKVRYQCVRRISHASIVNALQRPERNAPIRIPGNARWRWMLEDAGEWFKCPTGCCTGQ